MVSGRTRAYSILLHGDITERRTLLRTHLPLRAWPSLWERDGST